LKSLGAGREKWVNRMVGLHPGTRFAGNLNAIVSIWMRPQTAWRSRRFQMISVAAVARAAPSRPNSGISASPRTTFAMAAMATPRRVSRSWPVILSKAPTEPMPALTSWPRARMAKAVWPAAYSGPKAKARNCSLKRTKTRFTGTVY